MTRFDDLLETYLDKLEAKLDGNPSSSELVDIGTALTKAFVIKQNIAMTKAQQTHQPRPRIFDASLKEKD